MGFLLHKFAHFVHALRLFKALRLFFLTNFPGPTVIPCPMSIPDCRVRIFIDPNKYTSAKKIFEDYLLADCLFDLGFRLFGEGFCSNPWCH